MPRMGDIAALDAYDIEDRRDMPDMTPAWRNVPGALGAAVTSAGNYLWGAPQIPEAADTPLSDALGKRDVRLVPEIPSRSALDQAIDAVTDQISLFRKPGEKLGSDIPFTQREFSPGYLAAQDAYDVPGEQSTGVGWANKAAEALYARPEYDPTIVARTASPLVNITEGDIAGATEAAMGVSGGGLKISRGRRLLNPFATARQGQGRSAAWQISAICRRISTDRAAGVADQAGRRQGRTRGAIHFDGGSAGERC